MKRVYGLLAPAVALACVLAAAPATASAADTTILTVVGTSDVYDSHLVQEVIKPGFEAAHPEYTVNYVSKGTGAAIAYAKAGTADALLVHAASLENQFVGDGYSLETAGRAVFWGDYVLLGPTSDPVGVKAAAPHDVVKAFELVAAAGASGTANFVSRGGTPGTTVQEHAIWDRTSGLSLCAMSTTDGGGSSPSTTTGDCPTSISYPTWYHATGLTQGPNILNGDVCNYTGGNCYVLTDRGTFAYLQSTGQAGNLQIVTRDNSAGATGGITMLVNSFHAYAINPAKFPGVTIHSEGATALLDWITSPAGQAAVGGFLPADPPFIPDAAPAVTVTSPLPGSVAAGGQVSVTVRFANVVPGTPALSGVTVRLYGQPAGGVGGFTSGQTGPDGSVTFTDTPAVTTTYTVSTGAISQIEDAGLNPVFRDLLAPTTTPLGSVTVYGGVAVTSAKVKKKQVKIKGTLAPAVIGDAAVLQIYAARSGSLKLRATRKLKDGRTTFSNSFHLGHKGTWKFKVRYVNDAYITAATSAVGKVRIR